ncbi:MAG: hypothetical protein K1X88_35345 [Nannocystaceae bacterium]|nr:hypothetical protein [Nannocystaceae bacterium]
MDPRTKPELALPVPAGLQLLDADELAAVGGHGSLDPIAGCWRAGGITAEDDWEAPLV